MQEDKWGEVGAQPAHPGALPSPEHPGIGLRVDLLTPDQKPTYDKLMYGFTRLIAWQAELVNHYNEEDYRVYGEELNEWRERVRAFRRTLVQET